MDSDNADLHYANEFPMGYRFRPSDQELITFYLGNKVLNRPIPGGKKIVQNIDANALYCNSPDIVVSHATANLWCQRDERQWYFFLRHDCKQQEQDEQQEQQEQMQCEERSGIDLEPINGENQIREDLQNELDKEINEDNQINKDLQHELDKEIDGDNQINEDLQSEFDKEKVRVVGDGIGFWKSMGKEDPIYDDDGKAYGFKVHFSYYKGCTSKYRITHWMMDEYHVSSISSHQKVNDWVLVRIQRGKDYSGT